MGDSMKPIKNDTDSSRMETSMTAKNGKKSDDDGWDNQTVANCAHDPKMLVGKFITGLVLTSLCSIMLLDAWWETYSYYAFGLCLGLYIVIDVFSEYFQGIFSTPVLVKVGVQTYRLNIQFRAIIDTIVSMIMIITFIYLEGFTFGNILGLAFGLTLLQKVIQSQLSDLKSSLLSSNESLDHLRKIVDQLIDDTSELKKSLLPFNDYKEAAAIMKNRRTMNFLCIFICQCLAVLVIVAELFLISDRESYKHFATAWMMTGIGYQPLSLENITWISCSVLLACTCIFVAGTFKPSFSFNIAVSILAFCTGVFFALMSSASVMSIAFLKKVDMWEFIYKCCQLLPIPIIAVLLIVFSISTCLANVRLETSSSGLFWMALTNLLGLAFTMLACSSSIASQIWTKLFLENKWNVSRNEYYFQEFDRILDYETGNAAELYVGIQTGVACAGMIISLLFIFSGSRNLPGLFKWFLSAVWFGLSVTALWNIYHEIRSPLFEIEPRLLIINNIVGRIGLVMGGFGIFMYSTAVLTVLEILVRIVRVYCLSFGYFVIRLYLEIKPEERGLAESLYKKENSAKEKKPAEKLGKVTEINELR